MATLNHTIDTKQIKLTLSMPRFFGWRMWLTLQVLKLAGWIAPVTIEIADEDKIAAYDDLRRRADEMGFACVGEALDAVAASETPDGDDKLT